MAEALPIFPELLHQAVRLVRQNRRNSIRIIFLNLISGLLVCLIQLAAAEAADFFLGQVFQKHPLSVDLRALR